MKRKTIILAFAVLLSLAPAFAPFRPATRQLTSPEYQDQNSVVNSKVANGPNVFTPAGTYSKRASSR